MKIDIYVQRDLSALVVPQGCNLSKLPESVQAMASRSTGWQVKEGRDTSDHIIGLDVEAAIDGINKNGYYINLATVKIDE
ncbi:MAG: hypothetical protein J6Z49_03225 [Kiritimatiellae bacterium]|nr:hypothetical protein [Kiritimatiellia bacterium]